MTSVQSCLRSITPELWHAIGVGTGVAVAFVVVVGLITGGIDTPIIERRTPLLAIDYPIWVVNAALIGALSGLSVYARSRLIEHGGTAIFGGGFVAAFAVSCPLCNGLLVAAFGAGGVLNVIEPARPFIGAATTLFLAALLVRRWRTYRVGCENCEEALVPTRPNGQRLASRRAGHPRWVASGTHKRLPRVVHNA